MRKLFFAICFTLCLAPKIGSSAVRSMANLAEAQNASSETQLQMSQELMAEKQYSARRKTIHSSCSRIWN